MTTEQKFTRTGEALHAWGLVSKSEVRMALALQRRLAAAGESVRIGSLFVRMGLVDWSDVDRAVKACGGSTSGISSLNVPSDVVRRLQIMPLEIQDGVLYYAPLRPLSRTEIDELLSATRAEGYAVDSAVSEPRSRDDVLRWINSITYVDIAQVMNEADRLCMGAHDAQLMQQFVEHIFQQGLQERASDVHLERSNDAAYCWVSYRIDGTLRRRIPMTRDAISAVCTRVKSIAGLDISESRRPQDGRMSVVYCGRSVDLRVSSVPDHDGETVTVRILDQSNVPKLEHIFRRDPDVLARVRNLADIRTKAGGIVLVTGATGQGKSTTLSALLGATPRTRLKIMSIEDPVETRIPFVHQSAINTEAGSTYSSLLRSFMRQDPDVMMVGEIRDSETAQEFLKGAETGHMMLSTVHTNDLAGAVVRLMTLLPEDLRASATYVLSSSLRAILNQRLVPALCTCSQPDETAPFRHTSLLKELHYHSSAGWNIRKKVGCSRCEGSGYRGRELVVEAAFFVPSSDTTSRIAIALQSGNPDQILQCAGADLYPRIASVKRLLSAGLIDARTAESILDIKDGAHG